MGNDRFQNDETKAGGAGPGWHGASGVHSHMTNTRMSDPEVLETRFPVRVERMALRSGSGGAGEYHGGNGVHRIVRFLAPVTVTTLSSHRQVPPPGAHGGGDGRLRRERGAARGREPRGGAGELGVGAGGGGCVRDADAGWGRMGTR